MKIIETSLKRPVTVIILTVALVYFGLFSYSRMGVQQIPDVDLPVVMVTTTMRGATAQAMDNDVTDVLEEKINTISGIESLSSSSYMGSAVTVVQFNLNRDIDAAAADVRDKVNAAAANLPDEADTPIIAKFDVGDSPLVFITLTGDAPYRDKVYFADKVVKVKFESIDGVGQVELPGMRDREIRVWIDPVRLRSRGLVVEDLSRAISSKHVELPAGSITMDRLKMDLRIAGEYTSVDELKSLPITTRNGVVIRLGDVADVEDGFEEQNTAAFVNGDPTIMISVKKQRGANEVEVCDAIVKRFEEIKGSVPDGMELTLSYNKADFIKRSMKGVSRDVIQAVVLCSLLMLFFMQTIKATFVTVISIPVCLVGSFCVLSALGVTINNMSMMGISLAVGMVVDATTVVLENVHTHLEKGLLPYDAALQGSQEVAFAVVAGALTTIGVFAPIATMGGIIGRFFYAFGVTIVVTVSISLILSMTLTPFLCSRLLRLTPSGRIARFCDGVLTALENLYRKVLTAAVHHKFVTLGAAVALFAFGIFVEKHVGTTFMTNDDMGVFMINCELPSGTDIDETARVMEQIAAVARRNPGVLRTLSNVGSGRARGQSNKGSVVVQLIPRADRLGQNAIMAQVRQSVQGFRDVSMNFTAFSGKDVEMVLSGAPTEQLLGIAQKIIADINASGKMHDADTDVRLDKPQLSVAIDRNVTDAMNVNIRSLSTEIQAYFGGAKVGVYKEGGYRYNIRLMARPSQRSSVEDLSMLSFKNGAGEIVQAPGLITVKKVMSPSVIKRYGRRTAITLSANVVGKYSTGEAVEFITQSARRYIPKGSDITIQPYGRAKNMGTEFARLLNALIIAISLVYIIMAVQFESFIHPFTVMFSLPLMTPGTFCMMYLMDVKMDVMAYMGIILLVGIVVNNGIILVDFINANRLRGMDKVSAVIDAGPRRLRAILITSLSTMMGAVPAAFKLSEGSESRQPMSTALAGGLFTSTLLTLLVVPVVYLVLDNLKERFGRKFIQKKLP
ncbi:MAG: efflux RND transporter permease subunit [Pyramidobacter sp.]|jgi:HAE1 family hydrophobic/amphiphilic exporter-1